MGGSTFDVSLVNIKNNEIYKVKYTSGDTHLGWEDFNQKLVDYCVQEFCSKNSFEEEEVKKIKKH